jgi:hypothetical protein
MKRMLTGVSLLLLVLGLSACSTPTLRNWTGPQFGDRKKQLDHSATHLIDQAVLKRFGESYIWDGPIKTHEALDFVWIYENQRARWDNFSAQVGETDLFVVFQSEIFMIDYVGGASRREMYEVAAI